MISNVQIPPPFPSTVIIQTFRAKQPNPTSILFRRTIHNAITPPFPSTVSSSLANLFLGGEVGLERRATVVLAATASASIYTTSSTTRSKLDLEGILYLRRAFRRRMLSWGVCSRWRPCRRLDSQSVYEIHNTMRLGVGCKVRKV